MAGNWLVSKVVENPEEMHVDVKRLVLKFIDKV